MKPPKAFRALLAAIPLARISLATIPADAATWPYTGGLPAVHSEPS